MTYIKPNTDWRSFVTAWNAAAGADDDLSRLIGTAEVNFAVEYGSEVVSFAVADGLLAVKGVTPSFTLSASQVDWDFFFEQPPRPPYQSFFGMLMRIESAEVRGDELRFAQHVHIVRRLLEVGREVASGQGPSRQPAVEPVTDVRQGSYLQIVVGAHAASVYVEQAGSGQDLLLLHTAGADSRQFRYIFNDSRITASHRLVAFDLPGHGRSGVFDGMRPGDQALTTEDYAECVVAVVRKLGLNRPIVVGASMAGEICLELAFRYPDVFAGVIACEASERVEGRQVSWPKSPLVNASLFIPEWIEGLMAPQSPRKHRDEVWWNYSQGGYGTFYGDVLFYSGEWDGRDRVPKIDTNRCPVIMMTGEYDYSCTPEMSRATAARIPGATFQVMRELGHFALTENPQRFAEYFLPTLIEINNRTRKKTKRL